MKMLIIHTNPAKIAINNLEESTRHNRATNELNLFVSVCFKECNIKKSAVNLWEINHTRMPSMYKSYCRQS